MIQSKVDSSKYIGSHLVGYFVRLEGFMIRYHLLASYANKYTLNIHRYIMCICKKLFLACVKMTDRVYSKYVCSVTCDWITWDPDVRSVQGQPRTLTSLAEQRPVPFLYPATNFKKVMDRKEPFYCCRLLNHKVSLFICTSDVIIKLHDSQICEWVIDFSVFTLFTSKSPAISIIWILIKVSTILTGLFSKKSF